MSHAGDQYRRQAEGDEAVLHVLHHHGENDQVSVERSEDGAVDISSLKMKKH